jgi:hypothetical protein
LEIKSRFTQGNLSNINFKMSSFDANFYKTRQFDMFKILKSTVDINLAIVICTVNILNGLALNCLTIKWFVEDVSGHLFHFLDENHVHESCVAPPKVTNITLELFENSIANNLTHKMTTSDPHENEHVLFKSNLVMIATQLVINSFYFLCLILINYYKAKNESTTFNLQYENPILSYLFQFLSKSTTNNSNSTSHGNGENTVENKFSLVKKIFASLMFYLLVFVILALTLSVASFKFVIGDCESFFKKPSDYVCIFFVL